jgi:hypothetical protein
MVKLNQEDVVGADCVTLVAIMLTWAKMVASFYPSTSIIERTRVKSYGGILG